MVNPPLADTAPVAAILSQAVLPVPVMSHVYVPINEAAPFTFSVPAVPFALPGLTVEPLAIVSAPTVPAPASVPPLDTETAELPMEPLTSSVPALTVVPPLWVLVPDSVTVPVPCFVSVPVPLSTPE